MKFTIALSSLALLALSSGVDAQRYCEHSCGNGKSQGVNISGAVMRILGFLGCVSYIDGQPSVGGYVRYGGGRIEARQGTTQAYVRFITPAPAPGGYVPVDCINIYRQYNDLKDVCFLGQGHGVGTNENGANGHQTKISTCGGVWVRELDEPRLGRRDEMTQEAEEADVIDAILKEQGKYTGESVWHFPASGADSKTVCELAEKEPRLKEVYDC